MASRSTPVRDAEPVEQVDHVLAGDIAGRARRVGAAAEPRDRAVEDRDAALQRRQDVGERLAVGVVEMRRELLARHALGRRRRSCAATRAGVPTPIVSPSETS